MFATKTRTAWQPPVLIGTFAVLVLAACSAPDREPTQPSDATPPRDMALVHQAYRNLVGTEHPYVNASELYCATVDFGNLIHQGVAKSHGAISTFGSNLRIKVSDLRKAVSDAGGCEGHGPIAHAVTVHFGLDLNYAFAAALQVQCLIYHADSNAYELEETDAYYSIERDGVLQHHPTGLIGWVARYGSKGTYGGRVFIRHSPSGAWSLFDSIPDKRSMTFPYETELDSLIMHNRLDTITGLLRLVPIAVPLVREPAPGGGYDEQGCHQCVVWVPEGVVIDDEPYAELFKNKGADLGAACPPSCPKKQFRFDTLGVAPRAQCKPAK